MLRAAGCRPTIRETLAIFRHMEARVRRYTSDDPSVPTLDWDKLALLDYINKLTIENSALRKKLDDTVEIAVSKARIVELTKLIDEIDAISARFTPPKHPEPDR